MVTLPFCASAPFPGDLEAYFEGSSQRLLIAANVLHHIHKYRQTKLWSKEAGGQLFGTVTSEIVCVSTAIGPHYEDARSRYAFRSEPKLAQRWIDERFQQGEIYLGEWHTHAERVPTPSKADLHAMSALLACSKLSTSALLLMIAGQAPFPDGLTVCSFSTCGRELLAKIVSLTHLGPDST